MTAGRERRTIAVTTLASGQPLALDLLVVHGARPGPTVGVCAGIHGDELEGVLIIRELWEALDPDSLSGSVWLLPLANPTALAALSRNTPIDSLDLNRNFPGAPDGWASEQIAWAISQEYLAHLDVLVDIHAGGTFPWVDYCYVLNDRGLSRAFLSGLLYQPAQIYPGTAALYATARNVRTVVVEIGGGYQDQALHVANGVRGVLNTLRHAGALAGEVERRAGQVLLQTMKVMRPSQGGLCVPAGPLIPGSWIDGTRVLAHVVHPGTFAVLEEITTPFARNVVVLARNYITRIQPGDYMYMMGDGSTAERLD